MSSKSSAQSMNTGKSPWGNSSQRGRGWALKLTVAVLLVAAVAWITVYTQAVATAPAGSHTQTIDPHTINR